MVCQCDTCLEYKKVATRTNEGFRCRKCSNAIKEYSNSIKFPKNSQLAKLADWADDYGMFANEDSDLY